MYYVQYVVGECFKNVVTENAVVHGFNDFLQAMAQDILDERVVYVLGQGIAESELKTLEKLRQNYPKIQLSKMPKRESQAYVHKHKSENVMIAVPEQQDSDTYLSYLILDDDCAEMSDHVTGQHIQGMVIIEAARQLMLSVTERYLLPEEMRLANSFMLNSTQTTFSEFLFPFEVAVKYKITKVKKAKFRIKYSAAISFYQNEKKAVEVTIDYSVFDNNWMKAKESEQVGKVIDHQTHLVKGAHQAEAVLSCGVLV